LLDRKAWSEILNVNLVTFITGRKPDKLFWKVPLSTETVDPKSGTEIKCSFIHKNLNTKQKDLE